LKRTRPPVVLVFVILSLMPLVSAAQQGHRGKHGFGVKQYAEFHDVLRPLQHDALPNKNFKEIRAKSATLLWRGRAIVRLGVPGGMSKRNRAEFAKELRKFSQSLARYNADARHGTDTRLGASFSAVHDSFEMLMAMLPRA